MLFDPKWKTALPSFIRWLETMPADGTYDWDDYQGGCLIGQYIAAKGIGWRDGYFYSVFVNRAEEKGADLQQIAREKPWTYGAALDRARKLAGRGNAAWSVGAKNAGWGSVA